MKLYNAWYCPFAQRAWYDAIIAEPALIKTSLDQENYEQRLIEFYRSYSVGGGQSDVTNI